MEGEPCLSTKAASEALKAPARTIRRWCADGTLRSKKVTGAYLIDRQSVDEMRLILAADDSQQGADTSHERLLADGVHAAPPDTNGDRSAPAASWPVSAPVAAVTTAPVRTDQAENEPAAGQTAPLPGGQSEPVSVPLEAAAPSPATTVVRAPALLSAPARVPSRWRAWSGCWRQRRGTTVPTPDPGESQEPEKLPTDGLMDRVQAMEEQTHRLRRQLRTTQGVLVGGVVLGVIVLVGGFLLHQDQLLRHEALQQLREERTQSTAEARWTALALTLVEQQSTAAARWTKLELALAEHRQAAVSVAPTKSRRPTPAARPRAWRRR